MTFLPLSFTYCKHFALLEKHALGMLNVFILRCIVHEEKVTSEVQRMSLLVKYLKVMNSPRTNTPIAHYIHYIQT